MKMRTNTQMYKIHRFYNNRKTQIKRNVFYTFLYLKQFNELEDLEKEQDFYENEEYNYLYLL